ncbi:ParA family protein [Croceicoccus naphthovorans]|uniref:ParA n=1 Tax=Croceicoccus naphthovorans TaxID=1348774 RepID=A0A0G3XBN0_9SPHN|nr:ParA family protein [Croceicoccus naphthovorans]AKM08975.1 ParA [Croceicoccus naphthovorans]MBB3989223.1 chromosome partitioning protein [Croceicoccus naphthovorans]
MPTVAIVSQKGGSGKTTLACHLATAGAYAGKKTVVVDTDPQATAAAWADWRGDYLPEVVTSPPARLGKTIEKLSKQGVELIVIDTPPHADAAAREAMKAADLILIPSRPRAFDLHALEATAEMLEFVGKSGHVLMNGVPARATKMLTDAQDKAKELGLAICPVLFGERAAFHKSSGGGEVASEGEPDSKAAEEVDALWKWTAKQVGMTPGKKRKTAK